MYKKKISKALLISSIFGICGVTAAIAAPIVSFMNDKEMTNLSSDNKIPEHDETRPESSNDSLIVDESKGNIFSNTKTFVKYNINKISVKSNNCSYKLSIQSKNFVEGEIFIVDQYNNYVNEIIFSPGEKLRFVFIQNKNYENFILKDFIISDENSTNKLVTKNEPNSNIYTTYMPLYYETVNKYTGRSWLYDSQSVINVKPNFILNNITNDEANGGKVFDTFVKSNSGYIYNFSKNTTWSNIENKSKQLKIDSTKPLNLYFYLNGFDLIIDKNVLSSNSCDSILNAFNLSFYNSANDCRANKYGTIKVDQQKEERDEAGIFEIQGILTLGNNINHRFVPRSNGIRFLNVDKEYNIFGTYGCTPSNPSLQTSWK